MCEYCEALGLFWDEEHQFYYCPGCGTQYNENYEELIERII